jgi:histidine ammonia-lyase
MTVTLHTRADITLDVYGRVAWQGEDVHFDPAALVRIGDCRAAFLRLIEDPAVVVYGVTSGYGQMAHLRFTPEERRQHAAKPAHAAMASFGEPLPERVTRGMVLARLANFVDGHAAVSPALAEAVAGLLSGAPLPLVPALGNGCPGEILALSHLLTPLAETFDLGEKETLSLVNGSPCAAALIADAVLAGRNRLALAAQVFALSIEAMKAPLGAYDGALDDLWGDPHEAAALRSLRSWLEGVHADDGGRVLGQACRSLAAAEEVAATSLRSVSDNPVFLPPDAAHPNGRVFSTGGYHNAAAYPALDNLAACWADLALLCDRQVTKLMDGKVSLLPHLLMREDGYLGCLGFSAAGYAEQARQAAQRSFLPGSEGGGFAQNDVAVPTFLSWRKEAEAGQCLEAALAILAAIASQALYITERPAPPRLRPFVEVIHQSFPPVSRRRPLGRDADALHGALRARVYSGDVAENNRVLSTSSH